MFKLTQIANLVKINILTFVLNLIYLKWLFKNEEGADMTKLKKLFYPFILGAIFFGFIGLIAFAIKRAIEWVLILLKIIVPSINPATINPALLFILTLSIILILGLIIDKLLKKWLSDCIQQILNKCPPVLTKNDYLAFEIGESIIDGKIYTACVEPLFHFLPYVLAGPLKITPKTNLRKLVIDPLDLVTLAMVAAMGLEKFRLESFNDEVESKK